MNAQKETDDRTNEAEGRLYNFFNPDLWLARVDGMVWLLRMTLDAIEGTQVTLEGMSVRKYAQLLHALGVGQFEDVVEQIESGTEGVSYEKLMAQIKEAEKDTALENSLLTSYLVWLLSKINLPLSAPEPQWAVDFDFEVKQLINLRSLCVMYIYFFTDMRKLIKESLSAHQEAQTHLPLHLIQACNRHLANDFEILQIALLQRQPGADSDGRRVAGVLAKELVITDKLAIKAVAPFAHLLSNPNILTFFSQETHIRRLPFSDLFILVGLSHGRISSTYNEHHNIGAEGAGSKPLPALELLAIPHEIGHYLYHYAQLPVADSSQDPSGPVRFADLGKKFGNNPYYHWCEEIFADLYGCVVAGPVAVLGIQALLVATDKERAGVDDGEHPIPLVRPFILSEMLRVLESKEAETTPTEKSQSPGRYCFAQAAESLDANWTAVLQQWGFTASAVVKGRPASLQTPVISGQQARQTVHVEQVVQAVRPIVEEFVRLLLAHANFDSWATNAEGVLSAQIPWVRDDYATLREYEESIISLTGETLARQKATNHGLISLNFWDDKWMSIFEGETPDEKLQHWLDNWGDSGPGTIGGH